MIDKLALREAFINVIVHNDYTREVPPVVEIFSNRLCITSYGGLVEGLSLEEFFNGRSMPRNREIMRVFRDLDLVEQLGSGINRILKVYEKEIFNISENFIEIVFPFEKEYLEQLQNNLVQVPTQDEVKSEEQVREQVREQVSQLISILHNEMSVHELMTNLNLTGRRNFLQNYLQPSLSLNLIEMNQPDSPNSPTQKYRLTEKGKELQKQIRK